LGEFKHKDIPTDIYNRLSSDPEYLKKYSNYKQKDLEDIILKLYDLNSELNNERTRVIKNGLEKSGKFTDEQIYGTKPIEDIIVPCVSDDQKDEIIDWSVVEHKHDNC